MTTAEVQGLVVAAAQRSRCGLNPRIAVEQIRAESAFNPNITGPMTKYGTAKGIAQFIDATARQYGLTNPYDPVASADAYQRYMCDLLTQFSNSYPLALAAYNAGPGNVRKYGNQVPPFKETQNYVQKILTKAGAAGALTALPPSPSTPPTGALALASLAGLALLAVALR